MAKLEPSRRTSSRLFGRLLTGLVGAALVGLLALSTTLSLADHLIVGQSNDGASTGAPANGYLRGAVPPISWSEGRPGPSAVALTFDRSLDADETPKLLDVLATHDTRGTFFVTGSDALEHRDLVRRMVDEGHEIGLHSFNHPHMSELSPDHVLRQYELNQRVIVGVAGVKPKLARPPFSGQMQQLSEAELVAAGIAQEQADLTMVFTDIGPQDLVARTAEEMAAAALPTDGRSAIISFDGDGATLTAAQVARALDLLIPQLEAEGYLLLPASAYGGVEPYGSIGLVERVVDVVIAGSARLIFTIQSLLTGAAWIITPLLLLWWAAMAWFARRGSSRSIATAGDPSFAPAVSLVAPTHNNEVGIIESLESMAAQDYPNLVEVVVVDDGSTDETLERASAVAGVRLLSKPHGGRTSALLAGIGAATHGYCVVVDGDTRFEPSTVRQLVQPLSDPSIGVVVSQPEVANRSTNLITEVQAIDASVRSLTMARSQLNDASTCRPGAIAAFRVDALRDVPGTRGSTVAEATDLSLAVGSAGWHTAYVQQSPVRVVAPTGLGDLWRQRVRWAYGELQVMWRHRSRGASTVLGNHYRQRALAFTAVQLALLPLSLVVDLFAVVTLMMVGFHPLMAAVALTLALQGLVTWQAVHRLDGEAPRWSSLVLHLLFTRYVAPLAALKAAGLALAGRRRYWTRPGRTVADRPDARTRRTSQQSQPPDHVNGGSPPPLVAAESGSEPEPVGVATDC